MSRSDSEFIRGTPVTLPAGERERIEAEIQQHLDEAERLIGSLDDVDGDPDFCASEHDGCEPEIDEPDLGWPEEMNQTRALKACVGSGASSDLEEDRADFEPSLGSPLAAMHDQTRWSAGDTQDREEQVEDEGADEGAEYFTSLVARYIPPTKGDVRAAKAVRGFIRRVKRNGKLGAKIPVTAICVPAREGS